MKLARCTLPAVGLAIFVGACARKPKEAQASPAASQAIGTASASAKGSAPMMKEYTTTPPERLGTLAPGTGLAVGAKVPDVHASDLAGNDASLAALYAKGPILLVFYRGGWCPYCNFEIRALTKAVPDFAKRGVTPVAVSVDRPENAAKTGAVYDIPFPVLADPDLAFLRAFHVEHHVDDAELAKLKGFGIDLEASSGRKHHVIAIPSLFVIDKEGVVRWAHSESKYTERPSVVQILAAIDGLKL
ncbi:MAG: AhpC/TSA family protein [Myxococcales bacterium]|nr:AhpC/TSA family protein [Myxococcales bacterium]